MRVSNVLINIVISIDISLILITKLVFSYKLLIIGILINEYYKINKYYYI